jgi:DNA-directed RNA polymerase subunit RPC12/RpoP
MIPSPTSTTTRNGKPHALRNVTHKCAVCGRKFPPRRSDAKYCGTACRQHAHRARQNLDDLDRAIEQARLLYWRLIAEKARALGRGPCEILTAEAQYVDGDGKVWVGGVLDGTPWRRLAGHTKSPRAGWSTWGLEAAGPPWCPPSRGVYEEAILGKAAYREMTRDQEPRATT